MLLYKEIIAHDFRYVPRIYAYTMIGHELPDGQVSTLQLVDDMLIVCQYLR